MSHPGYTELMNHITERGEYATLSNFTTVYRDRIPGRSLDIKTSSTNGLHSGWCNRFNTAFKTVFNKMPPKPKRYKKHIWDRIFDDFIALKSSPTSAEVVEDKVDDDDISDSSFPSLPSLPSLPSPPPM
ncbi:unnamed protein product [Mucor hiemalis]